MADEEVKPVEEQVTETPPEATQEELPLAAATEETPEAVKEEPKPVEEPKLDWREKELKAKYRRQKELERELAEKQAELDTKNALLAKFNQQTESPTPVVPVTEIDKRVAERIAQDRYVEQANRANSQGEKEFGEEWGKAVNNLEMLGGFDMATMNGVLATDDPAKVIYELGKNPDRYHQIMSMPLERRIIEMGKLAMQPITKQVSNAPAPVSPVTGRAAPAAATLSDEYDDDKWYQIRLAQKRARWAANNSPRR